MKNKMNRKFVAGIEVVLMIVSIFAFMYFVGFTEDVFILVSAEEEDENFRGFLDRFVGGELIENESWVNYPISSSTDNIGCCFASVDGQICGTASPENCISDSPFAEGALCAATSFCEKGCCYNEAAGIYDKNVLEFVCPTEWVNDPNCNMPEARFGCCVLGTETIFETRGQCEVDSLVRAIGDSEVVDWRDDVGEGACLFLSDVQKEGACIFGEGGCKFVNEGDCFSYDGEFAEGYLCTSPSLNTSCEMTRQTRCVDGKDGVYFVDSCGNIANIYDSERIDDLDYWDMVAEAGELCGDDDVEGGNADSVSCGNCNRFFGGICASASEDRFEVDAGDFYCRDTSCMFDGVSYENGESWCVYDGAIGNGDDVVGSRHWKYVCSQGVVQVEPCADYRNQICIQSSIELSGELGEVGFSNAVCIANNWRACINLNSEEDGGEECGDVLNCRVESINIAEKFSFDICVPKYPGGFDLRDERYQKTAEKLCGMASQTCTVVYAPKTWGGCELVANGGCLTEIFAQGMNDFCRGLGDCGGSANVLGEWSGNYRVTNSPDLGAGWIEGLKDLAVVVPGQFAEVEDYSEFLEAAGILGGPGKPGEAEVEEGIDMSMIGSGVAGLGYAAGAYALGTTSVSFAALDFMASAGSAGGIYSGLAAFAGVAIGAGIGMVAGAMLAKSMGLSPGGSMLMAIGGGMVGAGAMMAYMYAGAALGPVGWVIAIIGVIIMIIASFFGGSDCPPVDVEFECKSWQPPRGGDDCEECNGDPLKPCSEYRCESLGAGCELINVGSGDELCVNGNPNDATVPVIRRQSGISFEDGSYEDREGGFSVVNENGGCLDAYTPLVFGVVTSEPTQCRYDVVAPNGHDSGDPLVEFEEMRFDLGSNSYLYNHTAVFSLPDPSHGESQGSNWTGDLNLYIKCVDRYGLVSPGFFEVGMCVREGDDRTAPRVVVTEPAGGGIVGFDVVSQDILIVTNELATCKWDLADVDYLDMENSLVCNDSLASPSNVFGYGCSGVLPIGNSSMDYYVKCMDQPWEESFGERNANVESFVFSLRKPSAMISIDRIVPEDDFEIGSDFATIDLRIATSGGGDFHFCSYSFSGYDKMIAMFETGNDRTHSQVFNLAPGRREIFVECRDETGDFVRSSTEFEIIRDSSAPQIARVWQMGGFVNLILSERGECRFSFDDCRFAWSEGYDIGNGEALYGHDSGEPELRFAVVRGEKYHIRCADEFGNMPNGCSVELVAI